MYKILYKYSTNYLKKKPFPFAYIQMIAHMGKTSQGSLSVADHPVLTQPLGKIQPFSIHHFKLHNF